MTFSYNRVVLTKDDTNKKILIKAVNHFCIPIFKLNLDIENAHFYVSTSNNNENVPDETLIIINDYKNLVGIDLDESDIKQKPVKFLYSFWNISTWKYGGGTSDHINNFIGTSSDDNPLFFNIDKYLKKNSYFSSKKGKYMRFSDHFFTYSVHNPFGDSCCEATFHIIIILLHIISFCAAIFLLIKINEDNFKVGVFIIFPIFNIILHIVYRIIKYCICKISRIDCIYSKDYDRVFIGLVKYDQKNYINTFEYQMNNISRFILEGEGKLFNLKVVLKNNEVQQICTIENKTQEDLQGLAYLLNERLNINYSINIDSN